MEQPVAHRPQILPGESLTSLIFRVVQYNRFELLDFLNYIRRDGRKTLQRSDMALMNVTPRSTLNMLRLSQMLEIEVATLLKASFDPILRLFAQGSDATQQSRFLAGMFTNKHRYCPRCLKEATYHRLFWVDKSFTTCPKHEIYLVERCPRCHGSIDLNAVAIGQCSKCGHTLTMIEGTTDSNETATMRWIEQSWSTLLEVAPSKFLNDEEVAQRLLYLASGKSEYFERRTVDSSVPKSSITPTLLQHARNSLAEKRALHLGLLMSLLHDLHISMSEFLVTEVPRPFVDSLTQSTDPLVQRLACVAPWCSSFERPGSLMKTGTTYKEYSDGTSSKYFMACTDCGCEYALVNDGEIQERTSFIAGYHQIMPLIHLGMSIKKVSAHLSQPVDQIQRVGAYFSTRLDIAGQVVLNAKLLRRFVTAVADGETLRSIQQWPQWDSYQAYLRYRYHSDVMRALHMYKRTRESKRQDLAARRRQVRQVLDSLVREDVNITIRTVCKMLKVCPETIRNWNCNELIFEAKRNQAAERSAHKLAKVVPKAEELFTIHQKEEVLSAQLYEFIGVGRTVLWRQAPEITAHLSLMLREHNKQVRGSDNTSP
ncbi:TniQ family protein [Alicyclobacillus sp. SO9]|uniref:TniQ family protein n=1 Tax=Alicyclobacillus sp. SO9 TaxID=2665646 RepID=UPI0018E7AAC3|nr:TniQ family protein [Alicyclobacillus sp. SO9]QQE78365.1 TniQ family protein [Alicyclobacillus sp. SO9]